MANHDCQNLLNEAARRGAEQAMASHNCPMGVDPRGVRRLAVEELANAKVVHCVLSYWTRNEGKVFLKSMSKRLGVKDVIVRVKDITRLEPRVRLSTKILFWKRFDHAKKASEPLGRAFSNLISKYLKSNDDVHRDFDTAQL